MTVPFRLSLFSSLTAPPVLHETTFPGLAEWLDGYPKSDKVASPLVKLAEFGAEQSAKGAFRHDANLIAVYGIEADYDGGTMPASDALAGLQLYGVEAIVQETHSSGPNAPRWRVLTPLSKPCLPEQRAEWVARLNAILGGVLAVESFTASQAFYIGSGHPVLRSEGAPVDVALADVAPVYPPSKETAATVAADWTDAPEEGWRNPLTLEQITARCNDPHGRESAPCVFGGRWTLHQLHSPGAELLNGDHLASEARAAYLARLMHLAGGNCELVEDLALEHGHCVKAGREDLLRAEILKARGLFLGWWAPEKARRDAQLEETRRIGETLDEPPLPTVMSFDQMRAELVYIESTREVAHRGTGRVRTAEAAKGAYAASRHRYTTAEGKARELPALNLWLQDPARITVDCSTWNPAGAEFCAPPEGAPGDSRAINTWRGLAPMPAPSDWAERVAPFLEHVAYLVPDEAQRARFLQWLGHIVQRPGELPHTSYLMTTSETGIGRNALAGVLARALRGHVAAGVPLGPVLDGKFNGRLSQKLLAIVDEAREGMPGNRYERGEALKRLIAEEHRDINPKYGHARVEYNCCRWLMFSNHDDALPMDANDRRVIVIENPTTCRPAEYYSQLYARLSDGHFIASVRAFLAQVDLSTFNPGERAPMSEAKRRAIASVASGVDRAVAEFKATWPEAYPVAPLRVLRQFVEEETGSRASDGALRHAMTRAGVEVIPGRRVRVGPGLQPERLVSLTPGVDWAGHSNAELSQAAADGCREFLT